MLNGNDAKICLAIMNEHGQNIQLLDLDVKKSVDHDQQHKCE